MNILRGSGRRALARLTMGSVLAAGCADSVSSPTGDAAALDAGRPDDVGYLIFRADGPNPDDVPGRCGGGTYGPCPVLLGPNGAVIRREVCHESRGVYACESPSARLCGPGFPACANGLVCNADNFCEAP